MALEVVILAAGQGTRMKSDLPKVLHPLGGRPLLAHVVATARALSPARTVVIYGHGGKRVTAALPEPDLVWVEQAERLGTGHAVQQALPVLDPAATVLVLYGDVPLIRAETLRALVARAGPDALALLTVELDEPAGYGRILRDAGGRVTAIREDKDATEAERRVREINTGILAVGAGRLAGWLQRLSNDNAQGEYYLTDIVAMAVADGVAVETVQPADPDEVLGVNSKAQLAHLERVYQRRRAGDLMDQGVTLLDPARLDVRGTVRAGRDVVIDVNVILVGEVVLGDGVSIGAGCVLRDVTVGDGAEILPLCVIEEAVIGPGSRVGPYSRIRPGTRLDDGVHVGNFVEVKNSTIGRGSKVNHLSYIGDTDMGRGVNIGAGTITCNYDGANKHRTVIEDDVFVGSDVQLVAPVTVGRGATIGAGSTITRDAPPGELTLSRARQTTRPGWKRPRKKGPGDQ